MRWGPKAGERQSDGEWLRKIATQSGKVPTAIAAQPRVLDHEWPFWEAFQFLHLSRSNTGFGPGAIPLSEIIIYAELRQMPAGDEREQFAQIIRAMDGAYLTWVRENHA